MNYVINILIINMDFLCTLDVTFHLLEKKNFPHK